MWLGVIKCFNRICASSTLSTLSARAFTWRYGHCFNRICASSTLSTRESHTFALSRSGFNRICASSTLSTRRSSIAAILVKPEFQSHLRLIHPIHMEMMQSSLDHCASFNRICASSTLSTSPVDVPPIAIAVFQSHLRLIHPIHKKAAIIALKMCENVSIASAPHPPYPPTRET